MAAPDKSTGKTLQALRFQKIKAEIHRQLVEMLDISRLGHWKPDRLRREVSTLAVRLAQSSPE
jgi:hypothetical protein